MKLGMGQGRLIAVLCLGMMSLWTQVAQAQAPAVGVVDEDKLAEGYAGYKKAVADIDQRAQSLDRQLASRELLNEAEGRRFDDLIAKSSRSVAEEQELTNLVKTGSDRRARYTELIGKANRAAAEETELKNLLEMSKNNAAPLQKVSDTLYSRVKEEQEKIDKDFTDRANKVIEQVAGDKKLLLVMRKRAVVWNSPTIDITDEVLTRLNK